MPSPVRVRIAPSPTGEPHVGTAYTALFNLLLAGRLGGTMILRIEDTDQARSTAESEAKVMEALGWLGLHWSEGPDKGGPYGPYRQSERREIYAEHAGRLLAEGKAFECFCTRERLEAMREGQRAAGRQPKYDGLCLKLSAAEAAAKKAAGEAFVIRMKVPEDGECRFTDAVYGEMSIPWETVDMQVIVKADGMPTYHLANVVDDHLMEISHVARGEEWLPSVPKHLLLYDYLGAEPPEFIHLPLLRNPDRTKLSKRRNPTSLSYFRKLGFLPEAMVNFLGLAFVATGEADELMDFDALAAAFDTAALSRAGAVFNMEKLAWLNGRWIRERLDETAFAARVAEWAAVDDRLRASLALAHSRVTTLSELPALAGFLFSGHPELARADFEATKAGAEQSAAILAAVLPIVDTLPAWQAEAIGDEIRAIVEGMGLKLRAAAPPLFLAVTGSTRSLPLFDSMALLGRAVVRERLKRALAAARG